MDQSSLFTNINRHGQLAFQAIRSLSHVTVGGNASSLSEALGNLRGPIVKVAQFLATLPGVLPPQYTEAFSKLQTQAPPMNNLFVRRRMTHELGNNWLSHFDSFDMKPRSAASLGQIHYSVVQGNPTACKLQYPNMQQLIETDLSQLQFFLKTYNLIDGAIDHRDILIEIRNHLNAELNYTHEAQNINDMRSHYAHLARIPKVNHDLSTERLLTMEWLDHTSIFESHHISPEERATRLFRAWYTPFYEKGWLHSDPHPGNYGFNEQGELVWLDFGCVRRFEPEIAQSIYLIYNQLLENKPIDDGLIQLGFQHLNRELIEALTLWAKLLLTPMLDNQERALYEDITYPSKAAMGVYAAIKKAGGVRPPQTFVLIDRTALALGGTLMKLQAKINWHRLFQDVLSGVQ